VPRLISGRDIVLVSSVDWDFLWQGQHEVATRLAAAGNRVLYVENLGVRTPRLTDAGRIVSRLGRWGRALLDGGVREVAPNLAVSSPLMLPPLGSQRRRAANRALLVPIVTRAVRRHGLRDPILWTYLPTDTSLDLIRALRTPRSVTVYTCVADFAELAPQRRRLIAAEDELLRSADVVLAQGRRLIARCEGVTPRVDSLECAVNLDSFAALGAENAGPSGLNGALDGLPRPIVGYVGGLHRHLDMRLAVGMARSRPGWSWVYVGPEERSTEELRALPNVRLLGHVPHDELAPYIAQFDVCTVPYALERDTDTVFPTKLLEYLAMGKPTVSTPLPEIEEFNADHGVVIMAAPRRDDFLAAIDGALAPAEGKRAAARRRAAESRDWTVQLEWISALIEEADGGRARTAPAQASP
jgi:glycosyltransferase involved in cell wall biosynthesis